jgi:predicted GNAT family acetyltransferase
MDRRPCRPGFCNRGAHFTVLKSEPEQSEPTGASAAAPHVVQASTAPRASTKANGMAGEIINNVAMRRYELPIAEDAVAVTYYKLDDGRVVLLHTEVPSEFGGQGIGKRLANGVFETLRAEGKRVIAKCPFMARYAVDHPEYASMLDG